MIGTIRIGDCLMLSQSAWSCGRAFNTNRTNSPPEFREVELELARLAKSLKFLAECLFSEDVESLLSLAEDFTQSGIAMVIQFCKYTLDSLHSLIEQYQVVRKTQSSHGYLVEKGWSDLVVSNYWTLKWTTDGGNISVLRDLLHMHTSVTAIIRQALHR